MIDDYHPSMYGKIAAAGYDSDDALEAGDIAPVVTALFELASRGGRALELGIGTGRIAIPLADTGLQVEGIDISPEMVEQLRRKAGGASIPVRIGSFADVDGGPYDLIYAVFSTFSFLTTQEEQVRCFITVAESLRPGGIFVIEESSPNLANYPNDHRVVGYDLQPDRMRLDTFRLNQRDQLADCMTLTFRQDGIRLLPMRIRYVWTSELDLMGRIAGLRLQARWSGWDRAPFVKGYGLHVSIFERPEA